MSDTLSQTIEIRKASQKIIDHDVFDTPIKSFEKSVVRNVINSVKNIEKGTNQSWDFLTLAMNPIRIILSLSSVISIKSDFVLA